ncbi:hypothetical protein THTE_3569 [Thermogutta terrifontis]|uniref:Uncharacterized protein n=1 Tax=Thermogutta terrifontis TaxID=1331910 RepID=A0A286RJM2_9BACT|nr:hypothetical protein THTE_3569 [Thermogutta terrifontis]
MVGAIHESPWAEHGASQIDGVSVGAIHELPLPVVTCPYRDL